MQSLASQWPPGELPAASSSRRGRLTFLALSLLAGAVAGLVTGLTWSRISSPPSVPMTRTGAIFGESQLDQQVGVTFWYLVLAVTVGVGLGFLCAWRRFRYGLVAVAAVAISTVAAGGVCYWTGVHVFGPDASAQLATATVGQRITAPLDLGTRIVFLGWPAGGLAGALVAIWCWPRQVPSIVPTRGELAPSSPGAPAPDALR